MIRRYTVSGRSSPMKGFGAFRSLVFFFCFPYITVMKPWSSATCSALSAWLLITPISPTGAGAGDGRGRRDSYSA